MRLFSGIVVASLVLLGGCGPGGATPAAPTPSAPVMGETAVDIVNFAFEPEAVQVSVGAGVIWTNSDSAPHTVTFDEGGIDSGNLNSGATFEHVFESAGAFAYHCSIHPNMRGTATVGP